MTATSASVVAERAAPNAPAGCLAVNCLESEEAYAAYLEPTEPKLQWNQIRSIRFENGQVAVRLNGGTGSQLWASLDHRVSD